MMHGQKNIKLW